MNSDNGSRKKAQRFEDLIAWQMSRILVREIYQLTSSGLFNRDFGLDQIRRAAKR